MDCCCCFRPPLPPPTSPPTRSKPLFSVLCSPHHPSLSLTTKSRIRRTKPMSVSNPHSSSSSSWDDKPFEVLPGGGVSYLDEQDIVNILDPPKELIPIDPSSYNPAAYLWKKIGDVPEERRHRLLYLLKSKLIARLWELAGTRYSDDKLVNKSASGLLSMAMNPMPPECWNCRTSSGQLPVSWLNDFRQVLFRSRDGGTYGHILLGGSILSSISKYFSPLYFTVRHFSEVMSTEQPCDLAYEFGDGILDLPDLPDDFPTPAKHRWPFNDHLVIYIRHAGPGVIVGQAWQEGNKLEQVPKKFCGEILMVKDYYVSKEIS